MSGSTTLVPNSARCGAVAGSSDGTKIAFSNDAGGPLQEELFLVNADGTNLVVDVETTLGLGVAAAAPPPPAVPPPVTGVNGARQLVAGTVLVRG